MDPEDVAIDASWMTSAQVAKFEETREVSEDWQVVERPERAEEMDMFELPDGVAWCRRPAVGRDGTSKEVSK